MNKTVYVPVLALVGAISMGCAGGSQVRSPDQWRNEVSAQFQSHLTDMRKCYLANRAPIGRKIAVRVTVTSSRTGTWWFPVGDKTMTGMPLGDIPPEYKQAYHASVSLKVAIDPSKGKFDIDGSSDKTDNGWYARVQHCIGDVIDKVPVLKDDKNDGSGEWTFVFDPSVPITDVPDPRLPAPSGDSTTVDVRLPPGTFVGDVSLGGVEVSYVGSGVGVTVIDGSLNCDANHCDIHGVTVLKPSKVHGIDVDIRNAEFRQGVDVSGLNVKR